MLDVWQSSSAGLPERTNMEAGQQLATARTRIIEQFLACLLTDIGCATAAGPGEKRA
jgi:hypothetical protein